jgi:hypothetical protein
MSKLRSRTAELLIFVATRVSAIVCKETKWTTKLISWILFLVGLVAATVCVEVVAAGISAVVGADEAATQEVMGPQAIVTVISTKEGQEEGEGEGEEVDEDVLQLEVLCLEEAEAETNPLHPLPLLPQHGCKLRNLKMTRSRVSHLLIWSMRCSLPLYQLSSTMIHLLSHVLFQSRVRPCLRLDHCLLQLGLLQDVLKSLTT